MAASLGGNENILWLTTISKKLALENQTEWMDKLRGVTETTQSCLPCLRASVAAAPVPGASFLYDLVSLEPPQPSGLSATFSQVSAIRALPCSWLTPSFLPQEVFLSHKLFEIFPTLSALPTPSTLGGARVKCPLLCTVAPSELGPYLLSVSVEGALPGWAVHGALTFLCVVGFHLTILLYCCADQGSEKPVLVPGSLASAPTCHIPCFRSPP